MKKIIVLILLVSTCLLSACSSDLQNTHFDETAIETDSSISNISESEAIKIAIDQSNDLTSEYDTYDATYYSDGTWRVLFYNKPITCGGGIAIVIDDTTKDIIDIIEQE